MRAFHLAAEHALHVDLVEHGCRRRRPRWLLGLRRAAFRRRPCLGRLSLGDGSKHCCCRGQRHHARAQDAAQAARRLRNLQLKCRAFPMHPLEPLCCGERPCSRHRDVNQSPWRSQRGAQRRLGKSNHSAGALLPAVGFLAPKVTSCPSPERCADRAQADDCESPHLAPVLTGSCRLIYAQYRASYAAM